MGEGMRKRQQHGEVRAVAHVLDVAAYILDQLGIKGQQPVSAMKLQKLCYYAYGHHLAWEERRLFPEHFEAWANGPVCPALYAKHRGRFELSPGDIKGDPTELDDGEGESVDLVLDAYGPLSAHQLSALTHQDGPWVLARRRAGAKPLERSDERLRDDEIAEYFDALASASAADGRQG
jgi:uncharacterized phage-associated protein